MPALARRLSQAVNPAGEALKQENVGIDSLSLCFTDPKCEPAPQALAHGATPAPAREPAASSLHADLTIRSILLRAPPRASQN